MANESLVIYSMNKVGRLVPSSNKMILRDPQASLDSITARRLACSVSTARVKGNNKNPRTFEVSEIFLYSDSIGSVRIRKLLSDNDTIAPSSKGDSMSFQTASRRDIISSVRKSLNRRIITDDALSPEKASK